MKDDQLKQLVYGQISDVFSALGEPRRLEILELLCQCERNVESLAEAAGAGVTTVSHHLQVLKRARLVVDRKAGRRVYYTATNMAFTLWRVISGIASSELAEVRIAVEELLAGDAETGVKTSEAVEYGELQRRIAAGEAVLIDVRPEEEYAAGHLPGAISISLETLKERKKDLPRNKPIYAYCRGRYCVLSHEAARFLAGHGYTVTALPDGISEWKAAKVPLESTGPSGQTGSVYTKGAHSRDKRRTPDLSRL